VRFEAADEVHARIPLMLHVEGIRSWVASTAEAEEP
jgi:hypothetical protein